MANKKVTAIPATLKRYSASPIGSKEKRKVAGYARVSTDKDDQFTNYEAQIDYHTNYIRQHADWEFVKVYTDEGITGTSTKRREDFKSMVADALDGKIDLIVTKSVSRFARNTVDSLTTIRELKENGTEVYFEKENIWTFDSKGELLITIMSSLAQEESRSISENCTWGQRKRFADGKVTVPFSRFLGYDRGEDGNLVVNEEEEEAVTVKRIYALFLKGMTPYGISRKLIEEGHKAPAGGYRWNAGSVKSILSNEKYKGDALLQKSYIEDFLTKKQVANNGEIPQYYVENNHEAIIEPEVFDMVQRELARRVPGRNRHSGMHLFSGRIVCGCCGSAFGSKVWHSNSKYKRTIWQCNRKFTNDEKCTTPHLTDEEIEQLYLKAVNMLVKDRRGIIKSLQSAFDTVFDTSELEARQTELQQEIVVVADLLERSIAENSRKAQDQDEYAKRYEALAERYDKTKEELDKATASIADLHARKADAQLFIRDLKKQEDLITEFTPELFCSLADTITVHDKNRIDITFKDGTTISVGLEES